MPCKIGVHHEAARLYRVIHEGIESARRVGANLSSMSNVEPVLWPDIFQPGMLTFEALENVLLRCCAAVFVASPDDQTTIRDQTVHTPRANIMLEFGLVAGRIGRHSIALCLFGGAQLPSDLQGLTVIDMEPADPVTHSTDIALRAEDRLRLWAAGLLTTADQIARTDILHGYSGRWDFALHLNHWRGRELRYPSYAYVNGTFDLLIASNGQAGKGFAQGRLNFKLVLDALRSTSFKAITAPRTKSPPPIATWMASFTSPARPSPSENSV